LQRALETYVVPKNISVNSRKKLSPIFRDTTELTAHHSLSLKIREAVHQSQYLIVLCSPSAQKSHWVNEEVRLFRKIHGEASILCVIAEGTPETAFPPALTAGGREPLAANLSGGKDSFKLGVTQLAASMLGVGLDALIQREHQRRRNRLWFLTASSVLFSALMGGMAFTAIQAQNAAETSRSEAEKMVEFMLTDLRQDLEPIGKLDVLDNVGSRVADYYDAIANADMDDDRLARQARARHLLGQVAIYQKRMEKAEAEIQAAHDATQRVLKRNPNDPAAFFAHAQSEYWAGEVNYRQAKYTQTLPYWAAYDDLASQLYGLNPDKIDWIMEAAWGRGNLGSIYGKLNNHKAALQNFEEAIAYFNILLEKKPDDKAVLKEKSNALQGAAHAAARIPSRKKPSDYMSECVEIYETLISKVPNDYLLKFNLIYAKIDLSLYDVTYNYNPVQDLKALTAYDPKNLVWVELLYKESYKQALSAFIDTDISSFKNYVSVFREAEKFLTQSEDDTSIRLDAARASIVGIMETLIANEQEDARRLLKQTLKQLEQQPENHKKRHARHFELICMSHQLSDIELRDSLIKAYQKIDTIKLEKFDPLILRRKLALVTLLNNEDEIKALSSALGRQKEPLEGQEGDCFRG